MTGTTGETAATELAVAVDGSPGAVLAAHWARDLAEVWRGQVRLLHVTAGPDAPADLERLAGETGAGLQLVPAPPGAGTDEIADAVLAASGRARMLVAGSHGAGATGAMLAGRFADRVARSSPVPVAIVRDAEPGAEGVVAGVGGGECDHDQAVVAEAAALAAAWAAPLTLVHAWSDVVARAGSRLHRVQADRATVAGEANVALEAAAAAARDLVPDVHTRVVEGTALRALLDLAATARAVVVGPYGATAPVGMQLGSTSRSLVAFAPCPVVVLPARVNAAGAPG
ncbi:MULTISPECIES: universal stress protein [Pseudonocardia]|uniref:Universal stress protein n=2 Tax=Pseudonocardia TaxID=1847 RepID=A0A1Y2N769_PSEAH|nr:MULTISPECIES: universal stress protein [Pseudonocardia]OSY43315.1 Universal stress protein [Pseudonocardia autotrophica]TDN71803.1 nucleotide-binding universal stress UspA family protein [Pseudonocardia autotrophica]BBG02490.1 universal stress protein [Pseudonocardia autotrophica]GEC26929.1 universal stress protein [Pseudonocardia saturnea]